MSRSNPNVNAPNPAVRWFEWNGETGVVRYYDKENKTNVDVPLPFTFLLLDELASVRGWNEKRKDGLYSNEVRDTMKDVMVVKFFKGGTVAEGRYKSIKDRVVAQGGKFNANLYIATKIDGALTICSLRLRGGALGAWMEFRKANRASLYDKAVKIGSFTEGKHGRVVFRIPSFTLAAVSEETNRIATGLDVQLQQWLDGYLQRKTRDQVEDDSAPAHVADEDVDVDDTPIDDDDYRYDASLDDDAAF